MFKFHAPTELKTFRYTVCLLDEEVRYISQSEIIYYSKRYHKWVIVELGFISDGATHAIDIFSLAWWVHDKLCKTGEWLDGTKCTNRQASMVLADILWSEGRKLRAIYWVPSTWLLGGGKARDNGMW